MKRKLLALMMLLVCMTGWSKDIERPKLIVGIVIDQMRWDYLYYYYDKYGESGLKRLLNEGFSCENNMISHVPTVTAIGHSTVYTGSVPAFHGIAGNNFYLNGHNVTSVTDTTVVAVGSDVTHREGMCSPRNMLANTIGDQLKLATDFKAKVYGVALKDRAAILPAGHSADGAFWWDGKAGHFITSSYYMDKLPKWVENFNRLNHTKPDYDIKTSNEGVGMTFKMATEVLRQERLGHHEYCDMLAISISSTDAIGHTYSTRGPENIGVYMELDKEMTKFLRTLDNSVGRGNYLLFLTADHGAVHNGNFLNEHHMPGGGWSGSATAKVLNEGLAKKFGPDGNYILSMMDCRIYLNHEYIDDNDLNFEEVRDEAVRILKKDPQFAFAGAYETIEQEAIPQFLKERLINGRNRERSGDLFVILQGSHMHGSVGPDYKGTSHGTWTPDDAHIPLLFMGWKVKQGSTNRPTFMVDVAPTVCAMLHIQMPDCCVGTGIPEVWR